MRFTGAHCSFSLVTTAGDGLNVLQRLPHIDTEDPCQFAVLHYLCAGNFGATGFFRHLATGYETITAARGPRYLQHRQQEMENTPPPPGYLDSSLPGYVEIDRVPAQFNRIAVYRSCRLHCGLIPLDMEFSSDPLRGRLTGNLFINYAPIPAG